MIRTYVIYDGVEYVMANQTAAEVKAQVDSLRAGWGG